MDTQSLSLPRCLPLRSRRLLTSVVSGIVAVSPAMPVLAQTAPLPRGAELAPADIRPFLGAWELGLVDQSRRCTVTLGAEAASGGRQLRFPATCRRALPLLSQAVSWSLTPAGLPRLNDAAGKALISFARTSNTAPLAGTGTDGQRYDLASGSHPRVARELPQSAAEQRALAAARPTAVAPSQAAPVESLPGRYVMMRQVNREACRILLAGVASGGTERSPASFEGRCDDTGLTIFDPVGWRYAAGRLSLVARKGHSVDFVLENGQWRKDPAVGAPLMLKKLP